jgi:hypothetical protein
MSKRYPEAGDDSALPPKRRDFVEINVGGRNFAAAISTLRANSSYFDALFSREWYTEEGTVFVDQDSDAFAVLQSFMRLGSIDSTKITAEVLLQAEFLGMDRLLASVKCVAYCNMNPNFTGSDEEAVTGFDLKYQGITASIFLGVLPKYLTEAKGEKKEYASIFTLKEAPELFINDLITERNVVVHVSGNATDRSVEEENLPRAGVPDCHRFLDALNWLHRHGYTVRERDDESMNEGSDFEFEYLYFSKKVQRRTTSEGLSKLIWTKLKAAHEDDCKQFAAIIHSYFTKRS